MFLLLVLIALCVVLVVGGRKTLKPLCHCLSVLLVLPSFLFAAACLVMQKATERTLFYFLDVIMSFIIAMFPWGTLVSLVCLALLLAAGCRASWRRLAAATVAALAVGSAAVMYFVANLPERSGDAWVFLPGALGLFIAGVLIVFPEGRTREFALQYPGGLRVGADLREDALADLRGQPGFRQRGTGTDGWTWYCLPTFRESSVAIAVELGFRDGVLHQISLYHDDPVVYGTGGQDKEHIRAENTRTWLRAKGFPVGVYSWGEVWTSYDPRSNFGGGGVRYNQPARGQTPALPASGVAGQFSPTNPARQELI